MTQSIQKIVIVGRDADAWISALLLKNLLGNSAATTEVELIEIGSELGADDFYSVLPSHKALHHMLGANESALMSSTKGYFSYGQRFANWSGSGPAFMQAYDRIGVDFSGVDFLQYWLKASANGLQVPLEDFCLGAVAAKQSRHVVFGEIPSSFSHAAYGYNLNAIAYVRAIAKAALRAGVKHTRGKVTTVVTEEKKIKHLVLNDGSEISANFFIDATGSEALLIKHLEENNIESWGHLFGCDRVVVGSAKVLQPRPAFSQIAAFAEGWVGFFPLQDRTAVSISYSSAHIGSREVLEKVTAFSGLMINNPVETPIAYGCRRNPWVGNCLAVGGAAVSADLLDSTQLHLLHVGLSLLRDLLPNAAECETETRLYNQHMSEYVAGVRDFQLAHYVLNKRYGEPFWDSRRSVDVPESLAKKIELFGARGLVAQQEHDTFESENWAALFIGHGLMPKTYNLLVNKMPEQEMIQRFQQLLAYIRKEVTNMPALDAYFEMSVF